MVTVITEIVITEHTSTEVYAKGSVAEGIKTHLAFEEVILREDPFQAPQNAFGYLATKHIGWLLGRDQCGTPLDHPSVDFDGWLDRALDRAFG